MALPLCATSSRLCALSDRQIVHRYTGSCPSFFNSFSEDLRRIEMIEMIEIGQLRFLQYLKLEAPCCSTYPKTGITRMEDASSCTQGNRHDFEWIPQRGRTCRSNRPKAVTISIHITHHVIIVIIDVIRPVRSQERICGHAKALCT